MSFLPPWVGLLLALLLLLALASGVLRWGLARQARGLAQTDAGEDVQSQARRLGVNLLDMDGRVGMDFGVYGLPETYLVDREGVVRFKHAGALTPEVVQHTLLPLMRRLQP